MLAAGHHPDAFTSRQLEVPGVSDHRKGLVPAFLRSCGLLIRDGGRGVFRATPAARRIAEAWGRDVVLGRRELAVVLAPSWFAEVARQESKGHGVKRSALASCLLIAANAPDTRRGEAAILIMWLLEAQLLQPVDEDCVCWNAEALASSLPGTVPMVAAGGPEEDARDVRFDARVTAAALADESSPASMQAKPMPTGIKSSASVEKNGQEATFDPVFCPTSGPDPNGRSRFASPVEMTALERLSGTPHTTVSTAGIAEDEMPESRYPLDKQPPSDGESPPEGDAIPPQSAWNPSARPARQRSQLMELARLGELAGHPIKLHELLQLTEEELLSMHRGLRRFVDATTDIRHDNIRP
ncbi:MULTISPECIES: hypothetical protein [unclassified Streptomyces]|uniref:hypothetical protein n=1 Tax=unclassified Streptomyces TaxID=2593676 RepID=UPI001660D5DB|nr:MULTISPECIES: hypothetical protein [unclassified Streptomyces]